MRQHGRAGLYSDPLLPPAAIEINAKDQRSSSGSHQVRSVTNYQGGWPKRLLNWTDQIDRLPGVMRKEMTGAPNANGPNKVVSGTDKPGDVMQEGVRIDQFWDKNRLVMPWMEKFLPENRMWQDSIATVIGIFIIGFLGWMTLHLLFGADKLFAIISIISGAYLLAGLNIRMTRAQRKFYIAKRNERKNG